MKLRQLFREQEEPQVADVIVFWLEGTETMRHILYEIPLDFIRAPDFEEKLRRIVRRNFNQVMIRYQVSGDTTSQGNPDGETPDTETPPVITSKDNEEVPPIEQEPDEVEAPKPEEEPEEEPDDRDGSMDVRIVTPEDERDKELARAYQQERFNTIDQDRDGVHDETGEELPVIMTDGSLTDPTTGKPVGAIEGTQYAERLQDTIDQGAPTPDNYVGIVSVGGGADGDTGDEGFAGEEGAVTGEQRAEIPSIIEELYRSISGLGTNETRMINALKRIESTSHLNAVMRMYRETYDQSLPQDIIDDLRFQGGNTGKVIEEINAVMMPLGAQLVGSQWFNLKWETFDPSEWSDVEDLYRYPITEYIAAREKYYQNLTRENEILFPNNSTDMRTDLSASEQAEVDELEAERNELLDKYGNVILRVGRGSVSADFTGADS